MEFYCFSLRVFFRCFLSLIWKLLDFGFTPLADKNYLINGYMYSAISRKENKSSENRFETLLRMKISLT